MTPVHTNIGDLSKPATTLIEAVRDAIGSVCEPWLMKRKANAEIEIEDLRRAAMRRRAEEDLRHERRLSSAASEAVLALQAHAAELPQERRVDPEWAEEWTEHAKRAATEDLEKLWGRLLASEIAQPGSVPKRAMAILRLMDRREAEYFRVLCNFLVMDISPPPPIEWNLIISRELFEYYGAAGLDYPAQQELASIGLLDTNADAVYTMGREGDTVTLEYDHLRIQLVRTDSRHISDIIRVRTLTAAGKALRRVVKATPVHGFTGVLWSQLKDLRGFRIERTMLP